MTDIPTALKQYDSAYPGSMFQQSNGGYIKISELQSILEDAAVVEQCAKGIYERRGSEWHYLSETSREGFREHARTAFRVLTQTILKDVP